MLSGLLGVGGGLFVVPILLATMGMSSLDARGTSLAVIIGTALAGSFTHFRQGNLDRGLAVLAGLGGVLGAVLGVAFSHAANESVMMRILAVLMVIVAVEQVLRAVRSLRSV